MTTPRCSTGAGNGRTGARPGSIHPTSLRFEAPPLRPDLRSSGPLAFGGRTRIERGNGPMFPFWEIAVAPVLEAVQARRIVEIGALRGENTSLMLERLGPDVELHVIDPVPDFDPA